MEYKGRVAGAKMYDDYAHHPTEIPCKFGCFACRYPGKRIVAVLSHINIAAATCWPIFGSAFAEADHVIIPGIYQVHSQEGCGRSEQKKPGR